MTGAIDNTPPADPYLTRILRHLILRSFPRLRRIVLTISWGAVGGELLLYSVQNNHYLIRVNDVLRPATKPVLEGGIAHELCHLDADLRMGGYQLELAWNRYSQSRWCRMREERATEWRVIELGYGAHLLAFVRFAQKLGYSFSREHGLLYAEICRALKDRKEFGGVRRFRAWASEEAIHLRTNRRLTARGWGPDSPA